MNSIGINKDQIMYLNTNISLQILMVQNQLISQ